MQLLPQLHRLQEILALQESDGIASKKREEGQLHIVFPLAF